MHALSLMVGIVAVVLGAAGQASGAEPATLNKCIGAEGKVTYSNLPCRNAREVRTVEIDPVPRPDPARTVPVAIEPAEAAVPKEMTGTTEPAGIRLDTQRTTGARVPRASARQCDTLTDKLGRVFDKMEQARRKGYTQAQMNEWNLEIKELERKKQQSGCF